MSETSQFRVVDLDCPSCASTVERALSTVDGVEDVTVHYATGRVEIDHDDRAASDTFARIIEAQGYTPQPA